MQTTIGHNCKCYLQNILYEGEGHSSRQQYEQVAQRPKLLAQVKIAPLAANKWNLCLHVLVGWE